MRQRWSRMRTRSPARYGVWLTAAEGARAVPAPSCRRFNRLRSWRCSFCSVGAGGSAHKLLPTEGSLRCKLRDGGAQVRLGRVTEADDERVTFERLLHHAALHPLATAMNQPHFAEALPVRGG